MESNTPPHTVSILPNDRVTASSNGNLANSNTASTDKRLAEGAVTYNRIRIERDYSRGEVCQFRVDPLPSFLKETDALSSALQSFLLELNQRYLVMERPSGWTCFENWLSCCSCFIYGSLCWTRYHRRLNSLDRWIDQQNQNLFLPLGWQIISPRQTAKLYVSLRIIINLFLNCQAGAQKMLLTIKSFIRQHVINQRYRISPRM